MRLANLFLSLALLLTFVTGCAPAALTDPPRLATMTAQAAEPAALGTPVLIQAPTPTATATSVVPTVPPVAVNARITVWVDETSPAYQAAARRLATRFTEQQGIQVTLRFLDPTRLPGLVRTAGVTGNLPDVIVHELAYTADWVAQDILDADAADAVVAALGEGRFDAVALQRARDADGVLGAVPSDGWRQLLLYRQDWFDAAGLPPPTTYDRMLLAAETFFDLDENLISGLVMPTEGALLATQRVFEQIAVANGCQAVDQTGSVAILHPRCLEALDFYRAIINQYSPPGYQTDLSAQRAYLAGRTAMIMTSPAILPQLAGLDPAAPPGCAECAADPQFLARNTGFVTTLSGTGTYGAPASYAALRMIGITTSADTEAARAFVSNWLQDGYTEWLAVEPELSVPLFGGEAMLAEWQAMPMSGATAGETVEAVFGQEMVAALSATIADAPLWGYSLGRGEIVGSIYEELPLAVILQEMLSGYITSAQAILEMDAALQKVAP